MVVEPQVGTPQVDQAAQEGQVPGVKADPAQTPRPDRAEILRVALPGREGVPATTNISQRLVAGEDAISPQ